MANLEQWYNKLNQLYVNNEHHYADIFRQIHQNPELSGEEKETSAFLKKMITSQANMSVLTEVKNGFTAGYPNLKKPNLCLRADLDALPIQEMTTLPYISIKPGVMHACGHDFHSTAVYAVAHMWDQAVGLFPKAPVFLFQHSEETIPGGALDFIEKQVHEDISEFYGLHVEPNLRTGAISLVDGWVTARSIKFEATLSGKGGHSARPWESDDPLKTSLDIIQYLYSNIPRRSDIQTPVVFTITQFNTGKNPYNAVPEKVAWAGTLRVADEKVGDQTIAKIKETIAFFAKRKNLDHHFEFTAGAPPVTNSELGIAAAAEVKSYLKTKGFDFSVYRSLGGDDFGWFSHLRPGFFIRVGITPPDEKPIPLHQSEFKVDFQALKPAIIFYLLFFIQKAGLIEE